MRRVFAALCFVILVSTVTFGQSNATTPPANSTPAPTSTFDVVDVHTSPITRFPFSNGGLLRGDRYTIRNSTMVDLIASAFGVEGYKVVGGPNWLEKDRFDVIAKAKPASDPETLKLMMQAMLADRFKLMVHKDNRPLSVFSLTVGKGKPKIKESDGTGVTGCQPAPGSQQTPTPGTTFTVTLICHKTTMAGLAQLVQQINGGNPVIDSTGLAGNWDFDIKWTPAGAISQNSSDVITIFDAVDKQLGLKLDPQKLPLPVIVVDSVNEKPTENPPEVVKNLPTPPAAEFDVAVIKPSPPGATTGGRIDPSGQVSLQGITLKILISLAWDLNFNDKEAIVGAPKWLDSDKFDIIAKSAVTTSAAGPTPNQPQIDIDDLRQMMRALLIDRFKMAVHKEERPVNAFTLVAANPKLKQADPNNRTGCKEGPGADGKDPRIANPVLGRLISCRNMTMAQFAEQLQTIAPGYIFTPVADATGLEGAFDFTLSFSAVNQVQGVGGAGAGAGDGGVPTASDPNGALSIIDAISKQLGLKLELRKRPLSVLVIDHVEEKPTDN